MLLVDVVMIPARLTGIALESLLIAAWQMNRARMSSTILTHVYQLGCRL
jgi:hypothetical protein